MLLSHYAPHPMMPHRILFLLSFCLPIGCLLIGRPLAAAQPPASEGWPLLAAPPSRTAPARPRDADADAVAYDNCMSQARDNPSAARAYAQSWSERGGGHPADHCLAVALVGLKQYRAGASRLETLAQAM